MEAPAPRRSGGALCMAMLGLLGLGSPAPPDLAEAMPARTPLATELPAGLPSLEERQDWEVITGDVDLGTTNLIYAFHVNPERQGLYQITQYRIRTVGSGQPREHTEKLVYNAEPGVRTPLHLYELRDGAWHRMPPGTAEYQREMLETMNVYTIHRKVTGLGGYED